MWLVLVGLGRKRTRIKFDQPVLVYARVHRVKLVLLRFVEVRNGCEKFSRKLLIINKTYTQV